MWCPECQSDVATEMSADGRSLLCTTCGNEVRKVSVPSLHPETRSARELLERWAQEQYSRRDPAGDGESSLRPPLAGDASPVQPGAETGPDPQPQPTAPAGGADLADTGAEPGEAKIRIDSAHEAPQGPARPAGEPLRQPKYLKKQPAQAEMPGQEQPPPEPEAEPRHRFDTAHAASSGPHFDIHSSGRKAHPGRMESLWGQLLAYAGVGLLTVGTVLVLWGYFGEVERYASTGWLISTAGQMLLLLGIVTLVAGGMQQTTFEVSERIEHLGGRIIRIEQSTDELLRGPHFGASQQDKLVRQLPAEGTDAA